jgi:drug/metabolite transporter (DMT)-like permease
VKRVITPAAESAPVPSMTLAFAWMTGMVGSLLVMGIAGRELGGELEPHHIVFYRNVLAFAILVPIAAWTGWQALGTAHVGRHVARNALHFLGQWCWLYGLSVLPIAEVFAIEFSSPIWVALLASVFLAERLTRSRVVAIGLGFTGILVLLRPGVEIIDAASLVVLAAALSYAIAFVITKNLVGRDSPFVVIWWMNVVQLPLGAVLSIGNLVVPSWPLAGWLVAVGVTGVTSHYCLSRALRHGDVSVVMPIDFLRLPLGALVAWLVYAEVLDPFLVVGGALILAGNWVNLRRG